MEGRRGTDYRCPAFANTLCKQEVPHWEVQENQLEELKDGEWLRGRSRGVCGARWRCRYLGCGWRNVLHFEPQDSRGSRSFHRRLALCRVRKCSQSGVWYGEVRRGLCVQLTMSFFLQKSMGIINGKRQVLTLGQDCGNEHSVRSWSTLVVYHFQRSS